MDSKDSKHTLIHSREITQNTMIVGYTVEKALNRVGGYGKIL